MRILFFGTPEFSRHILQQLIESEQEVVGVITRPDKPRGRGKKLQPSAVKEWAAKEHPTLPLLQPTKLATEEFLRELEGFGADVFVVAAFGRILREELLNIPRFGCINVHTSLLPKYRGAAPIQRAIMEGRSVTGVSIMYMVREMDAGDVLAKEEVEIPPDGTMGELEQDLWERGGPLLLRVLAEVERGETTAEPQDPSEITFAPKVELEDTKISWQEPATSVHNLVRASNPRPGAWCEVLVHGQKKRLKIWRTSVASVELAVRESALIEKKFLVGCGHGAVALLEVQLEGKRRMEGAAFFRGITHLQIL